MSPQSGPTLENLADEVGTMRKQIRTMGDTIISNLKAITTQLNTMNQAQGDITKTLNVAVVTLSSVQVNVSGLQNDVSKLGTDVATLRSDVTTLRSDVTTLRSDVSSLKTDMGAVKEAVFGHMDRTT